MSENQHLLDDSAFGVRLKYLEDRTCLFRPFLRPDTLAVLNRAIFSASFAGTTDPSALSLLATFVAICQPAAVLELGTYHGFSTLVFADLLSQNVRPGRMVTVEPDATARDDARRQVEEAGLSSLVTFVPGMSTDEEVLNGLERDAPFDLIYVDTSHQYEPTLVELDAYLVRRKIARPGALVFLHDITLPMGDDRGVGAAVEEWLKRNPTFRYLPLRTDGIWPNPCGLGLLLVP